MSNAAPIPAEGARSGRKFLRALVSLGLLSWLAWRSDWGALLAEFGRLRPAFWLAALGTYLLTQVVSGLRWQLLARPLGYREPVWRFTAYYFIGMFFNLFLPTSVGGDVVRSWYLDRRPGCWRNSLLSVFVDRASGLMVLLLIGCLGVAACPIRLPTWISASVWGMAAGTVIAVLMLPLLARGTGRFPRLRWLSDAAGLYLRRPGLLLATAVLSVIVQAANVGLVWLVGQSIQAPVPGFYYWILVPMVSLLTLLPVSLNGMGIREGSTVFLLAPLGVAHGTALCLALVWFSVLTAASICGGCVYLFGRFDRPEAVIQHGSIGRDSDQGRTGQSAAAA